EHAGAIPGHQLLEHHRGRIPGRDHRRYYHEYWRSEYLMDFDPQRHGMICMVCGSSLATLKLSTIKRHIRQKHPDSLLWSAADKEVIRSGWESHLGLSGGPEAPPPAGAGPEAPRPHAAGEYGRARRPPVPPGPAPAAPQRVPAPCGGRSPPAGRGGGRYLNDSLHAWFRQEFLMEYEAEAGRLLCMVCGAQLPSLHLDHIKSHVLDTHPNSLVYSSEEKHCILQAWAQTHGTDRTTQTPGLIRARVHLTGPETVADHFSEDAEALHLDPHLDPHLFPEGDGTLTQDTCLIGEDGGVGATQLGPPTPRQPKRRRLRGGDPWRLRLDYLVAYGPRAQGTFCMVCSQVLHETKVSSFRRHIQECHPETTALSLEDREFTSSPLQKPSPPKPGTPPPTTPRAWRDGGGAPAPPRQGHYPGKDQRRNYQARWRMDYLMDYDGRRHGLICMVCGATLATLKVSTIKRHIQQVHPHSLDFTPQERQQALQGYSQRAVVVGGALLVGGAVVVGGACCALRK
uniref:Si:dkey-106g10.7 n=1 Tax=Salarias fasciatus TaxID=181472 RepID=A0A672H3C1_SALFA